MKKVLPIIALLTVSLGALADSVNCITNSCTYTSTIGGRVVYQDSYQIGCPDKTASGNPVTGVNVSVSKTSTTTSPNPIPIIGVTKDEKLRLVIKSGGATLAEGGGTYTIAISPSEDVAMSYKLNMYCYSDVAQDVGSINQFNVIQTGNQ